MGRGSSTSRSSTGAGLLTKSFSAVRWAKAGPRSALTRRVSVSWMENWAIRGRSGQPSSTRRRRWVSRASRYTLRRPATRSARPQPWRMASSKPTISTFSGGWEEGEVVLAKRTSRRLVSSCTARSLPTSRACHSEYAVARSRKARGQRPGRCAAPSADSKGTNRRPRAPPPTPAGGSSRSRYSL